MSDVPSIPSRAERLRAQEEARRRRDPQEDDLRRIRETRLAVELKETFGITPAMNLRKRVERLYDVYNYVDVDEIAEALEVADVENRDKIQRVLDRISEQIDAGGRDQTEEEKARFKGASIRRLETTLRGLHDDFADPESDAKEKSSLANRIATFEKQLSDLRGIGKKSDAEESKDPSAALAAAISRLPTERIEALRARIRVADVTASG